MSKHDTRQLCESLTKDVNKTIVTADSLVKLAEKTLLQQPDVNSWNVAQVLEHLNAYNRYYLPEIEKALKVSPATTKPFSAGFLGDYFTKLMLPGENGTLAKKMSAPKGYVFSPQLNATKVLLEFIEGQKKMLTYLQQASAKNLAAKKVPTSLSKIIKLKLGDTFRFVIAHQVRHFAQIDRILNTVSHQ